MVPECDDFARNKPGFGPLTSNRDYEAFIGRT